MKPSDYIKKGWTRGAYARNKDEEVVNATNPKAVSWCLAGAMSASNMEPSNFDYRARLVMLIPKSTTGLTGWNDSLKTPRRIIALMEQVEQELGIN